MTNADSVLVAALFAALFATACTAGSMTGDPLVERCGLVRADGYCGVVFGMTPVAASHAFATPLETYYGVATATEPPSCYMLFPKGRANYLSFMVVDGVVARVDVQVPGIKTEAGAEVGMREADLLSRYGALAASFPNKYDPSLRDIVVAAPSKGQYVFESDGQWILRYRAGILPAVGFVERCG